MVEMDDIIKKMEAWLNKNNAKQYELARKLNTTESNVSRWLSGKHKVGTAWRELIRQRLG